MYHNFSLWKLTGPTCFKIFGLWGLGTPNFAHTSKVGRVVAHQPSKPPFPAAIRLRPKPHMTSSQSTKAPAAWHRAMTSRNLENRGTGNLIRFFPPWTLKNQMNKELISCYSHSGLGILFGVNIRDPHIVEISQLSQASFPPLCPETQDIQHHFG